MISKWDDGRLYENSLSQWTMWSMSLFVLEVAQQKVQDAIP